MPSALLVRLRPVGPWRLGPENGAKDRTDTIFHSDSLFSALTLAMRDLGWIEQWIEATAAAASPLIRLSSCYPYAGRTLFVQPPRSLWPMAQTGKLRWKSARFVPVTLIAALLREEHPKEEQWAVDPVSECLLPVTKGGPLSPPFRISRRRFLPVDRVGGSGEMAHELACLQFSSHSGMWFAASFASNDAASLWSNRIRAASRLLADTGVGGARSRGWGRSDEPRFESIDLNRMFTGVADGEGPDSAWWMLSLFSPSESDAVDWRRGNYGISVRTGRTESVPHWGVLKQGARMVSEGSVLLSAMAPSGTAHNVAREQTHPVYRSGIALSVPIPWKEGLRLSWLTPEADGAPVTGEPESGGSEPLAVSQFSEPDDALPAIEVDGAPVREETDERSPAADVAGTPAIELEDETTPEASSSDMTPVAESEEPSETSDPDVPSPVTDPDEPAPVTDPDEPSPVTDPDEPAPVTDPDEPSPVTDQGEPSLVTDPDEPTPVTEPGEPTPVTEPGEPDPVRDPDPPEAPIKNPDEDPEPGQERER